MNCEKCGKDCDNLTSKPAYNGNKDVKYYCDKCFEKVHNE